MHAELVVELVHDYADAFTRARLRRVVRDLPLHKERPWGVDVRRAHAAFARWARYRRPVRRTYRNSWRASARARRTDDTPILT